METTKERELSLYDMFWAICLKWRSILAVAIVFAVLAGAFSYVQSAKQIEANSKIVTDETEDSLEKLYTRMSYDEQKMADGYLNYKKSYDDLVAYNENAPLMQLDANDFYKGEISFYIDTNYAVEYPVIEKKDDTVAITNAYKSVISSQDFANHMSDVLGIEKTAYALEMVDSKGVYAGVNALDNEESQGLLSICVYAKDEETCLQLEELVKENVLAKKNELKQQFGEHEINVLKEEISRTASAELLKYQKANMELAYTCSNNMYNMYIRFADYQKAYINQARIDEGAKTVLPETTEENTVVLTPTISKKMIVLGFLGGACLIFVFWAFVYIFSTRLRLEENFEQIFSSKLLGNVPMADKKKKWFFFVDGLFEKLRHFNKRYFALDDALDMVAANIRIAMKNADSKKIMFTGAACGEEEKKMIKLLEERLKKDGIEIVFESSILYNAESLEKLVETGRVVLVERAEKTFQHEVAREIEICTQQNIDLIGTVIVY